MATLESVSTFVVGRPNITQFPESPDRRPRYLAADAFVLMVGELHRQADAFVLMVGELHRQQFWTGPVQPPGYGGSLFCSVAFKRKSPAWGAGLIRSAPEGCWGTGRRRG